MIITQYFQKKKKHFFFFFFNDTATTEIYTLSLHDALPICAPDAPERRARRGLGSDRHVDHALRPRLHGRLPRRQPPGRRDGEPGVRAVSENACAERRRERSRPHPPRHALEHHHLPELLVHEPVPPAAHCPSARGRSKRGLHLLVPHEERAR